MPSKKYALEAGGPERVQVDWDGAFKNLTVTFDGAALGSFESAKDIETPQSFALSDGSRLEVVLAKIGPFPELRLSRDGEPLPGSAGDPQTQLEAAANMIFAIAALNAILGFVAAIFDLNFLKSIGVGWASVLTGAIYAGLAVFVRKRSFPALAIAVGLFILDGLYMFVAAAEAKASPPIGGVIARVFFLIPMVRGFGAITELNKPRKPKRRAPSPPGASRTMAPRGATAGGPATTSAAPPSAAPPTAPPPPAAPPAVRTLSGEAEKLRLKMSERQAPATAVTGTGRTIAAKGPAGVDAARKSLRFIAHKCEIGESGLRVTLPSGEIRDIPFDQVTAIVARQLPPDPPWEGALVLDIVPSKVASPEPVRIFGSTMVNYAAIPGGNTNRLDNTRRLTAFLRDRCPGATLDPATEEFVRGPKVPQRFANMTQFIEYDSTYD